MTAYRFLVLVCDSAVSTDGTEDGEVCPTDYGGDPAFTGTIMQLREDAAVDGWRHDSGRDLCPAHAGGTR